MPKEVADFPDNNTSESSDFRAHAKIRSEDLQAEEFIKELAREFAEFSEKNISQQDLSEGVDELSENEGTVKDSPQPDEAFVLKDSEEPNESFLKRMLQFFNEYYERLISPSKAEGMYRSFTSRELRKKKLLLAAMIETLKKLLLGAKTRNLLELLDEQIVELRKALESEQDPELRKALQDRINLLTQLRMQLLRTRSLGGLEAQFFMLLLGSKLAATVYRVNGEVLESSTNYSTAMGRMFDISNVNFASAAKDTCGVSLHPAPSSGYHLDAQMSLSLIMSKTALSSTFWTSSLQGIILPDGVLVHFSQQRMDEYAASSLFSALNKMVRALAHEVVNAVYFVYKNTASFVVGTDPHPGRGLAARNFVGHERGAAERLRAQDVTAERPQHLQNVVQRDFHQQAHVCLEQNRTREEGVERSVETNAFFGAGAGVITCEVSRLTYTYSSICVSQTVREQQRTPDTAVEKASVANVAQSQVVIGHLNNR